MQHHVDDDDDFDAFATKQLWRPSLLPDDATTHESLLFSPLQLDGESALTRRVARASY